MNPPGTSVDSKSLAVGLLTITACILFVGFVLVVLSPMPVYGTGQLDRGGDYIMLTQQLSSSTEGLVVVDAAARRLLLYAFDFNAKQLKPLDAVELRRLRGVGQDQAPGRPP